MIDVGKRNVLGISINAIDYAGAIDKILHSARNRRRCTVTALAVHGLVTGVFDPVHRYRLNSFDLAVPDGQPVRWAMNLLYGTALADRVYGPKLTLFTCIAAAEKGLPVFFYGSRPAVLAQLCDNLRRLCPGLVIAGVLPSLFRSLTAPERASVVQRIKDSGARILFAGLGCPRQEIFAYEMGPHLDMPILAVGAAFDYYSGHLREPSDLIQRMGLQWLHRLAHEPRRLWRRYLFTNSQFVLLLFSQLLRIWSPNPANSELPSKELFYG